MSSKQTFISTTPMPLRILLLLLLTTLLSLSLASPTTKNLTTRSSDGLGAYICTEANWDGNCRWVPASAGCQTVNAGLSGSFSFGPDQGLVCKLFNDASCTGVYGYAGGVRYPGFADVYSEERVRGAGIAIVQTFLCKTQ